MKVVVLGASSPFSLAVLKKIAGSITHLFLQSKDLASLQRAVFQLKLTCPVELIDGDFAKPSETYLDDFEHRLSRLNKVDLFICSIGAWYSHMPAKHTELQAHFTQWQVNYFFPLALIKMISKMGREKTICLHNNSENVFKSSALNSLNAPVSQALTNLLQIISLENKWDYITANLPFYQSPQAANVFTALKALETLDEYPAFLEQIVEIERQLTNTHSLSKQRSMIKE